MCCLLLQLARDDLATVLWVGTEDHSEGIKECWAGDHS